MINSTEEKFFIIAYFLIILAIGVTGNLWVISSIIRILHKTWSLINNVFKHMSFYVFTLSIVDLFVSLLRFKFLFEYNDIYFILFYYIY